MDKAFSCRIQGYWTVLSLCPRCTNFVCKDLNEDQLKYISGLTLDGELTATTIKKMEELKERFKC